MCFHSPYLYAGRISRLTLFASSILPSILAAACSGTARQTRTASVSCRVSRSAAPSWTPSPPLTRMWCAHFFFTLVTGPSRSLSIKLSDTKCAHLSGHAEVDGFVPRTQHANFRMVWQPKGGLLRTKVGFLPQKLLHILCYLAGGILYLGLDTTLSWHKTSPEDSKKAIIG